MQTRRGGMRETAYRALLKSTIPQWLLTSSAIFLFQRSPLPIQFFSYGRLSRNYGKRCEAWGFEYKSVAFVWLKQNRSGNGWFYGLGFWTRGNAEICLLATKGHPKRQSNRVHQFIISPLRGHSKKPDEARDKIIELVGNLPRVELFAREKKNGWDAWGNEIDCDLEIEGYRSYAGGDENVG